MPILAGSNLTPVMVKKIVNNVQSQSQSKVEEQELVKNDLPAVNNSSYGTFGFIQVFSTFLIAIKNEGNGIF